MAEPCFLESVTKACLTRKYIVCKLLADVLPASVNPLEQEFDDDAGGELDLRRDKDEREVITC